MMRAMVTLLALAIVVPTVASALPINFVDNRPFVEVRIDGKGPYHFMVDTGSSVTTVSADLARRLRLRSTGGSRGGGAGDKPVAFEVVHIRSVRVGSISIGPLDAPAIDGKRLSQAIGFRHFDGVLGADAFKGHVITMEVGRRRLLIEDPARFHAPPRAIAIPFQLDESDMPIVSASVAGLLGTFQIDTGDRSSLTLFGPFWRMHNMEACFSPTIKAMTGYGVGGPIFATVLRMANVRIGSVAVPKPVTRLSLQTGGSFTRTDRAGSIGMGIWKRFDISFDYAHHVMWLTKGRDFDVPDRYDRSGLWLGLSSGTSLQVYAVSADSPAARAGIRTGDLVGAVGFSAANPATLFAIRRSLQSPAASTLTISASRDGRPYRTKIKIADLIAPPAAAISPTCPPYHAKSKYISPG